MGTLNTDLGADADTQPFWVIEIPFKDPSLGPPLTISSNETPASLRAIREFQAAVAKATPIVYAPDADYQECLAIALEMEKEAALEKTIGNAMASLSISDASAAPNPAACNPNTKKKRKIVAPPPPPPSEPTPNPPPIKKKRKIVAPPPPPPSE